MNWRACLAIAQKDILDAMRNMYLLFCLIVPIGLSLVFRVVFADITSKPVGLTIAVFDPGASQLVAALRALPGVQLVSVASDTELPAVVEDKAVGGLAVPAGFDDALQARREPELAVYVNRSHGSAEITAFRQLVREQVWALAGQQMPAAITWTDLAVPSQTQPLNAFRIDQYLLVTLLVMSLVMSGTFVVPTLLVEEKEKHTLDYLAVSPAGPAEITVGKALTGLVYSLLSAAVLIGLNRGWEGNWPVTAAAVVFGALFTVGVGLLMGSLFRNMHQVNSWSTVVMLVLLAPSWVSVVGTKGPLDTAMRLVPTRYLTQSVSLALAGEAALPRVWSDFAIMAGCVAAAFAVVVWRLQREER